MGRGGVARSNPAIKEYRKNLLATLSMLKMDSSFATRYVNDGFSGGEKKRLEVLQMAMLKPKIAMLDEPDSGLDIDAVREVAAGVNSLRGPQLGILLVTHYQRILNYIKPDVVHVMIKGRMCNRAAPNWRKNWKRRATIGFAPISWTMPKPAIRRSSMATPSAVEPRALTEGGLTATLSPLSPTL